MKLPIKQRILNALQENGESLEYQSLLYLVFPSEEYPRARRNSSNGGPPGCAMALGRALRDMDYQIFDSNHAYGRTISIRKNSHGEALQNSPKKSCR